jgi:membrane-associated phospholipid phosphatase
VATVLGARYRKLRVPLYILAAAVGWARINAARHFPSDVFVGAAVGIYSGRYVLRHGGRLWSIRF